MTPLVQVLGRGKNYYTVNAYQIRIKYVKSCSKVYIQNQQITVLLMLIDFGRKLLILCPGIFMRRRPQQAHFTIE